MTEHHTHQPAAIARPFWLQRDHDVSGVSGTGIVAHGVLWPDGTASVRWTGERPSVVFWDSIDDAIAVHGHGGATRIVFAEQTLDNHAHALAEQIRAAWKAHDPKKPGNVTMLSALNAADLIDPEKP